VGFYTRTAQGFLQGMPATAEQPERMPASEMVISGIGGAIDRAIRVASDLERSGNAEISKIATVLVGTGGQKAAASQRFGGQPQVLITLAAKRGAKKVAVR